MYFRILLLAIMCHTVYAKTPDGGGALPEPRHGTDRVFIEKALQRARINAEELNAVKGPSLQAGIPSPALKWPVRKSIVVTDPDVQAISNFLDQDPSEGGILDFDCGDRTYDGHNGLDIFTTPFTWYKMENDHAIVVAAAAGTISEKVNDQPERSCTNDNSGGENNLVVIEHQDGSMAVYAHMRTGSLTAKAIGDTVTVGEYLGVVGSAGYSTGPHLHFEVGTWVQDLDVFEWTPQDPYSGTCNDLNVESWWQEQPAYNNPALNAIATHSQAPEIPACPETELPHYSNSFTAGDTAVFAAYYRDQLKDMNSHYKVSLPNGDTLLEWDHASEEEHFNSSFWFWSIDLPANSPGGEWLFTVTFEEQTVEHQFFVDAVPEPNPTMPASNNAYNGAWYDPGMDGEGYNILTARPGTVVYFYGSDVDGERLWLISDLVTDVLTDGKQVTFVMYESTGGTHDSPIGSARGLSVWGSLEITFTDCGNGTAVLRGEDGEKTSAIVKLVGVAGTNCVGQPSSDGPRSGAWFDLAFEGEGFNLVVTPVGTVIYYYGFDNAGNRLWLISGVINETLQAGQQVSSDLYKATTGTFSAPVPSDQALSDWGSVSIDVVDCAHLTFTTDSQEGLKISATLKIAGVVGLTCVD